MKNLKILDHPIDLRIFYLTLDFPLALSILSIFIIPALPSALSTLLLPLIHFATR
jgi:hypothetical protein